MDRPVRKKRGTSKEFEQLAAQLESSLAPKGASVKSPDRIRDKVTGQFREVDASIRYSVGSSNLLITIECRDRVRTQDVTWIEQLATKRFQIGADRTLAVSSTPFTAAALRAAKLHNISTRLISEVTDEDIRSQMDTLEVTLDSIDLELQRMRLHYVGQIIPSPALDPLAAQAWSVDYWNAPIFRVGADCRPASLDDLFILSSRPAVTGSQAQSDSLPYGGSQSRDGLSFRLLKDVPLGAPPVTKDFLLTFDSEKVFALTDFGLKELQAIGVAVTATRSSQKVPPSRIGEYATEEQLITRFREHKIEWRPGETLSVFSRPAPIQTEFGDGSSKPSK